MNPVELRCPTCNAHASPGAEWCTLCYADLRTPEVPVDVPAPEPAARGDHPQPGHVGNVPAHDERAAAEAAAERMLTQLAAESDAALRSLAGNVDSAGAKVALIAGGSVVVLIVLFGLMALIGSLLPG